MTISNWMKMAESPSKWVENTVLVMSNFSFSHSAFKRLVLQTCRHVKTRASLSLSLSLSLPNLRLRDKNSTDQRKGTEEKNLFTRRVVLFAVGLNKGLLFWESKYPQVALMNQSQIHRFYRLIRTIFTPVCFGVCRHSTVRKTHNSIYLQFAEGYTVLII